jgi:hypothetical protein
LLPWAIPGPPDGGFSILEPDTGPASGFLRTNFSAMTVYRAATPICARIATTVGACAWTMQITVEGSKPLPNNTRLTSSSGCRVASQTTSPPSLRRASKRSCRRLPRRSNAGETRIVISVILRGPCEMTILAVQNRLGWYDQGVLDFCRIPQHSCRPRHWSNGVYSVCSAPKQATSSNDRVRADQKVGMVDRRLVTLWLRVLQPTSGSLPR